MNTTKRSLLKAAITLPVIASPLGRALAQVQGYPNRPIKFIVGQTAGGPTDIVARMLAQRLPDRLGQAVVVENRPGAASNIAAELVAHSAPDGYTFAVVTVQHIINQFLFPSIAYDPVKDFEPVSTIATAQVLFVCNPSFPAKDLRELIAYAKANPGKVTWAHSGSGGAGHLAIEELLIAANIKVLTVPYKGATPALTDTLSGQVQVMAITIANALPHIKTGKLRALALANLKRSRLLPDVATVAEQGFPGFEAPGFLSLLAPAKTPAAIIQRMQAEVAVVMKSPDLQAQMDAQGIEPVANTPAESAAYLQRETKSLGDVIRKAGIKAD